TGDPPTYTRVSGETQNVLRKFGQIQVILLGVVLALLACTILVVVSVMAYAAVQRRAIFGLLITLGFGRRHATGAFALEYLILLTLGAALGVLAAWGLIQILAPRISMLLGQVSLPSTTVLLVGGVTLGIFACGMALPMATLWRVHPTDASRF
ncbi:MAG: FtsX-like permease family protein, partial [Rhodanobacteraceae bacterium]